ncbi:MAG: oligosaccharide flippase family protein, partial [Oscillospiraceae bacterium]|nr:oligosaccharide flippase family protein [Oscillospiraceae bacterium]
MMPDIQKSSRPSYLRGAAILASAAILAKIIGAIFKIPLGNLLDDNTYGLFSVAYRVYALLLAISYAGIPTAMSRLVSAAVERGETRQARRYFKVALPAFAVVGMVASVLMFVFAPQLASFMEGEDAALAIRVLSPAVFLCCVVSVYEGYSMGYSDMMPTAVKQIVEVTAKLVFGLGVAWLVLRPIPKQLLENGKMGRILTAAQQSTAAAAAISGAVIGLALALPVLIIYKRRRTDRAIVLRGETAPIGRTLGTILKVSIPITLGSAAMSVVSLADTKIVRSALMDGAGLTKEVAGSMFGIYEKAMTLFTMVPAL